MAPGWPYRLSGSLALSRATHDRVAERRLDDAWLARAWSDPTARVLVVADGRAPVIGGRLAFVPPAQAPAGERLLLGVGEDSVTYLAVVAAEPDPPGGPDGRPPDPRARGLREVGALLDDREAGLLVHAVAIANWHAAHRRCARCGAPTEVAAGGHLRRCPVDGSEHYPRTDPAVIVAVVDDDDRVLLGRQASWPPGRFSTLAGFVEPGESLEAAVAREVREESAVEVAEVAYAGSQPWPFPSSLMCGFYARAVSTQVRPDGAEIAEARWYSRDQLRVALDDGSLGLPPPVSIARRLVEGWYGAQLPDAGSWRESQR